MKSLKDLFHKTLIPVIFIITGIFLDRVFFLLPAPVITSPASTLTASLEELKSNTVTITTSSASGVMAVIIKVIDGDTVELQTGEKVRYIGVDTPESVAPNKPVECFAKEAYEKNRELVEGKSAILVKDISDKDRYGRLLRYVYVNDIFINAELVENGYAKAVAYPPDVKFVSKFNALSENAKTNNLGLWGVCEKKNQTKTPVSPAAGCLIKGNVSANGEKIYHLPNCPYYLKTAIDENKGEKFFCSEEEALKVGWRKALNCN